MKVMPFTLLGATVLASVQSSVALAVRNWAADWGIPSAAVTVAAQRACEGSVPGARQSWTCVRLQERHAFFAWHPESAGSLQKLMFAADANQAAQAADPPYMAQAGGRKALEALAAAIAGAVFGGAAPGAAAAANEGPQAHAFARGAGTVMLSVGIDKHHSHVLLDEACVRVLRTLDAAAARALPPLAPVNYPKALSDIAVALDLTIGAARVGLGNLMSLAVGDVIRLDTLVEQPVALTLNGGAPLLSAYMGKAGDSVAVELTRLN